MTVCIGREPERPEILAGRFCEACRRIIGGQDLVGVYLHGSAAMGCYHPAVSDSDLLVVITEAGMTDACRLRFMEAVVKLNEAAPPKGIEMSVVKRSVCNPFVYPTPYELHFSAAHLERWRKSPAEYIAALRGTDRDLAAHFTVIRQRGQTLYGEPVADVFGEVSGEAYFDSLLYDVGSAAEGIVRDPMYFILNLARVLGYKRRRLVLSKEEGGRWALDSGEVPERFRPLLRTALDEYRGAGKGNYDIALSQTYAAWMLEAIRS